MNFYLRGPRVQGFVQTINQRGMRGYLPEMIGRAGIARTATSHLKALTLLRKDYISIVNSRTRSPRNCKRSS